VLIAETVVKYQDPRLLAIRFYEVSFIYSVVLRFAMALLTLGADPTIIEPWLESLPSPTEPREDLAS
jgi:hypothetical protein